MAFATNLMHKLILVILSLLTVDQLLAEEPITSFEKGHTINVGASIGRLKDSKIYHSTTRSFQEKSGISAHSLQLGYMSKEDNFIKLLSLPVLWNDRYTVEVKENRIIVKELKSKKIKLRIELENLDKLIPYSRKHAPLDSKENP